MGELYELLDDPAQRDVMRRNAVRLGARPALPPSTWRRYMAEYAATGLFVLGADGGAAVAYLSHEQQGTPLSQHLCAGLALAVAVGASAAVSGGACMPRHTR